MDLAARIAEAEQRLQCAKTQLAEQDATGGDVRALHALVLQLKLETHKLHDERTGAAHLEIDPRQEG